MIRSSTNSLLTRFAEHRLAERRRDLGVAQPRQLDHARPGDLFRQFGRFVVAVRTDDQPRPFAGEGQQLFQHVEAFLRPLQIFEQSSTGCVWRRIVVGDGQVRGVDGEARPSSGGASGRRAPQQRADIGTMARSTPASKSPGGVAFSTSRRTLSRQFMGVLGWEAARVAPAPLTSA
ncbi:MAG: hypothetical protein IPK17_19120 [Chloroflexi bacterium]|uniref:hypothetical protein n=1 Tax=Candidatus Flexifilum breve TaxID=3140694 RepID=UPI00313728EE|nr:hypothetical protein [Chloroflexota bacterium]